MDLLSKYSWVKLHFYQFILVLYQLQSNIALRLYIKIMRTPFGSTILIRIIKIFIVLLYAFMVIYFIILLHIDDQSTRVYLADPSLIFDIHRFIILFPLLTVCLFLLISYKNLLLSDESQLHLIDCLELVVGLRDGYSLPMYRNDLDKVDKMKRFAEIISNAFTGVQHFLGKLKFTNNMICYQHKNFSMCFVNITFPLFAVSPLKTGMPRITIS